MNHYSPSMSEVIFLKRKSIKNDEKNQGKFHKSIFWKYKKYHTAILAAKKQTRLKNC